MTPNSQLGVSAINVRRRLIAVANGGGGRLPTTALEARSVNKAVTVRRRIWRWKL